MTFLDQAEDRLDRYFTDGWWDIYDGVQISQDAALLVTDLIISVALNSQLDTRNKIWHVWQQRANIEQALSQIPSDISLEAEHLPWSELYALFEQFCLARYAKEAVATKVLHKKRPQLIPIYDRFVGIYFQPLMSLQIWRQGGPAFLVEYMRLFREILLAHQSEIHRLCATVSKKGWTVTPVRMLEVLIWMEYEPSKYYQ